MPSSLLSSDEPSRNPLCVLCDCAAGPRRAGLAHVPRLLQRTAAGRQQGTLPHPTPYKERSTNHELIGEDMNVCRAGWSHHSYPMSPWGMEKKAHPHLHFVLVWPGRSRPVWWWASTRSTTPPTPTTTRSAFSPSHFMTQLLLFLFVLLRPLWQAEPSSYGGSI